MRYLRDYIKKINFGKMRTKKIDPQIKELSETLGSMGLDTTVGQVQQGLTETYPEGAEGVDQGVVIRELYRYLKQMK